jgi:hypothetical protein
VQSQFYSFYKNKEAEKSWQKNTQCVMVIFTHLVPISFIKDFIPNLMKDGPALSDKRV